MDVEDILLARHTNVVPAHSLWKLKLLMAQRGKTWGQEEWEERGGWTTEQQTPERRN